MARLIGTVSRGVRAPIIKVGDDIASIVADSVIEAAYTKEHGRLICEKNAVERLGRAFI